MSAPKAPDSRIRAYAQFLVAVCYYFLARVVARHAALGLSNDKWAPLVEQIALVFLLLLGFAGLGFAANRQSKPIAAQGFPRREDWLREVGTGISIGWGLAVFCACALAAIGGISIFLTTDRSAWEWLAIDLLYFAFWALAEEIIFRGYAFQRFARAVGSAGATLGFALFYGLMLGMQSGSNRASMMMALVFSVLLTTAYLRTRALWLSWGLNFAWKASRAILFGLAVNGVSNHSPVVEGNPMGPFWLTGGGYGLDASWLAFLAMLAAFPLLFRVTRDWNFRYNAPEIVAGGIAVDLDSAARRQHEAAMGPVEPAAPALIQIASLPVATQTIPQPKREPGNDLP